MSRPFPYTYISCPCAETTSHEPGKRRDGSPRIGSPQGDQQGSDEGDEDGRDFDPRSPRSNFSLYPPEHLLYCEDCHQIKCPRCITEEIVCWYCPNCLFETPSSMVRSEGNRCARNCFNCPVCTAPLAVSTLEVGGGSQIGPWVLSCGYCMWTTLDIGIKFDKPTNIRTQLSKITESMQATHLHKDVADVKSPLSTSALAGETNALSGEVDKTRLADEVASSLGSAARFAALKSFYRNQLAETSATSGDPLGGDFGAGFSSPGALNRIMSIYTSSTLSGLYGGGVKKSKSRPPVMREAQSASEGLEIARPSAEHTIIQRMASDECGWDGMASVEQRTSQPAPTRFLEDLLPLPVLLRTKRSKRCKSCKHILVKPEFKPQSTRFRIRLIALSYIPLPTLRPLAVAPQSSGMSTPSSSVLSPSAISLDGLVPLKPLQLLLTLKNHMFDPIRVTLATPSITPGRVESKVTILCPQFDIGANSDVWDEALQASAPGPSDARSAKHGAGSGFEKVAEAGKVWDRGRNWTTVVLEVVPGTLSGSPLTVAGDNSNEKTRAEHRKRHGGDDAVATDNSHDDESREDEDVLEIPVFVRMEWDSENQNDQPASKTTMVKRELAYWMVVGVGRIVQSDREAVV